MIGLGKPFRKKNQIQKIRKHNVKTPHVNTKPRGRKRFFLFKHRFAIYFKIHKTKVKKFHAAKPLAFSSTSCFGVTKITIPI